MKASYVFEIGDRVCTRDCPSPGIVLEIDDVNDTYVKVNFPDYPHTDMKWYPLSDLIPADPRDR